MVKYNALRIKQRDEQYENFCQRKKTRPGVYQRISWELMTRRIIPDDNFEQLNLPKRTLERIFTDLEINSMQHTGTSPQDLQTINKIFYYTINHPKNRGKTPKLNEEAINHFLKKI